MLSKNWIFYHKSQISLKAWEPDLDVDNVDFESTPVWIQLPKLPWRFWTPKGLSKLASYVGLPIARDKLTTKRARLSYARMLVEVNIRGKFLNRFLLPAQMGVPFNSLLFISTYFLNAMHVVSEDIQLRNVVRSSLQKIIK